MTALYEADNVSLNLAAPSGGLAGLLPGPSPRITILSKLSLAIAPGERVLVTGASGSGKSTLFRAVAGIWPHGAGRILVPEGARPLFLPQRPYMPIGTLAEALRYPDRGVPTGEERLARILGDVGLGHLAPALGESAHWAQRLSGGEQQRLAIARALVLAPELAVPRRTHLAARSGGDPPDRGTRAGPCGRGHDGADGHPRSRTGPPPEPTRSVHASRPHRGGCTDREVLLGADDAGGSRLPHRGPALVNFSRTYGEHTA